MAFFTIKCDLHYTNKQLACNVKMKKKKIQHIRTEPIVY